MNHQDIVARIKASEPADAFTTAEGILRFLLHLLAALPKAERGGLLRKDAGENIAFYAPANCNVSISRVCYPDGQLWKILTDSGPGGANGPAWNDDGTVDASRYIDIAAGATDPAPVDPPVPPAPTVDLSELIAAVRAVRDTVIALGHEVDTLKDQIQELVSKPEPVVTVPPIAFPSYSVKVPYFGTFTMTPKP